MLICLWTVQTSCHSRSKFCLHYQARYHLQTVSLCLKNHQGEDGLGLGSHCRLFSGLIVAGTVNIWCTKRSGPYRYYCLTLASGYTVIALPLVCRLSLHLFVQESSKDSSPPASLLSLLSPAELSPSCERLAQSVHCMPLLWQEHMVVPQPIFQEQDTSSKNCCETRRSISGGGTGGTWGATHPPKN